MQINWVSDFLASAHCSYGLIDEAGELDSILHSLFISSTMVDNGWRYANDCNDCKVVAKTGLDYPGHTCTPPTSSDPPASLFSESDAKARAAPGRFYP